MKTVNADEFAQNVMDTLAAIRRFQAQGGINGPVYPVNSEWDAISRAEVALEAIADRIAAHMFQTTGIVAYTQEGTR